MKLNDEQRGVVEENHNLIFGYIRDRGLDEEEWYGLLAIELCKSVLTHDESKSKLSTYFYMRSDSLMTREYNKSQAKKRLNNGILPLNEELVGDDGLDDIIILSELMESEHGDIIRLRSEGYTQKEIANMLDISQAQVSRILKGLRLEYDKW